MANSVERRPTSGFTATEARLTGREYLRVSEDRSGRLKSPAQQHQDNQRSCDQHGITLLEPYQEKTAVSASRYSRDVRDDFERLMADLRDDQFGADVLVLWESSRGSRKVIEWVTMLDLLEQRRILVHVTTHGRTYDPANARDRRSLIDDANDSEYEAAKTAARIRRDMAASAAEGRPHGKCPYGMRPVYHERTGKLITWEADPDTSVMVQALFERLRKGHALRAIARDFAREVTEGGYRNGRGNPFTPQHLRGMAAKAVYAGYRDYKGELIEGTWEPIVDRELFWDVQRILSEPGRQPVSPRPGAVRHAFTRIIRCDRCGGPITTLPSKRGDYMCQDKGCVTIKKEPVDLVLTQVIVAFLSRPDIHRRLTRRSDSSQARTLTKDLAQLRAELTKAENASPANLSEARMFARLADDLKSKISDQEGRLRSLTVPSELVHLIEPGADVAQRWADSPVSARRKAAAILFTPAFLGQVRIGRSPGRRVPARERIIWDRSKTVT